jgi:epoxyqueuosine reductase
VNPLQADAIQNPENALTRQQLRSWALEAGFDEAGVVALPYAAEERDAARFTEWVQAGRAGTMSYLERTDADGQFLRERMRTPFPWARSAVVCFASYHTDQPRSTDPAPAGSGWMARYAWSSRIDPQRGRQPSDYHKVLLKRLRLLEARVRQSSCEEVEIRGFVDTGPVMERSLAVAAGLGWMGKNTCLIHPKLGSYGFLAVLLTSIEFPMQPVPFELQINRHPERSEGPASQALRLQGILSEHSQPYSTVQQVQQLAPNSDHEPEDDKQVLRSGQDDDCLKSAKPPTALVAPDRCGSCTRCIEACPTGALTDPYQMDATRCIAYLTIEHKGPIAESLMGGMGRQVFGCDICQDVCPWNRKAPITADPELQPRPELVNPLLEWLAKMDEAAFEQHFNGSPVRRAGLQGLRRNVAIAIGNSRMHSLAPWLKRCSQEVDEGVCAAVRWALDKLLVP